MADITNYPEMTDELLQKYIAQAMQQAMKPADSGSPLSAGLLSAGLAMMAGSRGRSFGEALGQGGLLGLQAYGGAKEAQRKDPMQMIQLATAAQALKDRQLNQQSLANFRQVTGPQQVPARFAPGSDYGPGEAPGPVTPPMTPQMVAPATTAPPNLTRKVMQDFLLDQSPQVQAMAKNWLEQQDKGARKLKDTKTLTTPDNQRVTVNIFDDGTTEVVPFMPDKEKPTLIPMGGKTAAADPYTLEPFKTFVHDPTPGEVMTDKRAREEYGAAAQRHREDLAQREAHFQAGQNKPVIHDTDQGPMLIRPQAGTAAPIIGPTGQPVDKAREPPTQFITAKVGNAQLTNKIDFADRLLKGETVDGVQGDPDALLPVLGNLPGVKTAANLYDQKGVATRAAVADIASQIILTRSGAAVSLGEFDRAIPFIPRVEDSAKVVREKLGYLRAIIKQENDALDAQAKAMGYRQPRGQAAPDPLGIRQ